MVDFNKLLKGKKMAPKTKANNRDDFEDDFGVPVGGEFGGDMPDVGDEMPAEEESKPLWIRPSHVGRATAGTLEVVKVLPENTQYSDVVLLVQFGGKNFRLGMKAFSDDYKSLKKKFGPKRTDWHGEVRYKVIANNGKPYIAVRG